ncbi:MAG: hypothetical protein FWC09_04755 [Lachnospiraceae bacterium]|nr:hypothetical protein [Lachnospiraceae bacterium]
MKKFALIIILMILITILFTGCNKSSEGIIDLTILSSTMVYGEINNIMTTPEDYLGRRIRMNGNYYALYYDVTDSFYHYAVIEDATSCCQQGVEFILSENYAFPDDYPTETSAIEIEGVFDKYEELGEVYYFLAVDSIKF